MELFQVWRFMVVPIKKNIYKTGGEYLLRDNFEKNQLKIVIFPMAEIYLTSS
jgi:hypothetical protein